MSTQTMTPRLLGGEVSDGALRADLDRYRELALELGASDAKAVPTEWISVDERVRLKCTVPRCLRAGETPNCPPNAPDLDLVRRAIGRFSWAILLKIDVGPIEEYAPGAGKTKEEKRRTLSFHKASAKVVCELERGVQGWLSPGHGLWRGFLQGLFVPGDPVPVSGQRALLLSPSRPPGHGGGVHRRGRSGAQSGVGDLCPGR